jgi:alkylated DNA nucleotide flippase Atl1
MAISKFDDGENRNWPHRAQQIWQILISYASNKQLITYGELAKIIGFKGSGVLAHPLGHIMNYCQANDLPPLTSIVFNQTTGRPGIGLTAIKSYEYLDLERLKVFKYNWYRLIPPTIEDYEAVGNDW